MAYGNYESLFRFCFGLVVFRGGWMGGRYGLLWDFVGILAGLTTGSGGGAFGWW